MNDELEQKRQEKIANFKLDYQDDEPEETEISSSSDTDEINTSTIGDMISQKRKASGVEFIMDIDHKADTFDDISSGKSDDIDAYKTDDPDDKVVLDKKSLRIAQKADRRRRKAKERKNRVIFRVVWLTMVIFVSIMIGQFLMIGVNDVLAVGREDNKSVSITIPKNATLDEISDILFDNHVINNKGFFKIYAFFTRATSGFTNGTFDIATNKDYQAIINYMQSDMNRTDIVTLQFTEGMSVRDYAKLLENGKVCSSEDFLDKCNSNEFDEDYTFLKDIHNANNRYYKLEGYLFPDTYDFYVGEDTESVVRKFLTNYRRRLYLTKSRADGFEKKVTIEERAKKLGMSMEEVINLASLIQAEAANKEDMYVISSILHNRLDTIKNDGRSKFDETGLAYLQLDSTVYYPYSSEQDVPASMRKTYVSRYSTYKYQGLPNGPICNPGLEAIIAAVTPDDTEYYYFCHKSATEDSPAVAYYAKTNNEHLKNQVKAGLI